jgi:ketosteroid isomerase-like protein
MGRAWDTAQRYFGCVREGDADGVAALFADDGVFVMFDGTVKRGRADIRDFCANSPLRFQVTPEPLAPLEDGNRCAVEVLVREPDGNVLQRPADFFTVDDGGAITILRAFIGPTLEEDPR